MKPFVIVSLALSIALGVVLLTAGPGLAQMKVPEDFALEQGEKSPGPVTFSHAKHKEKVAKCTGCHVKVFKMKRGKSGPVTMAAMEEGKLCGACHDGKTEMEGTTVFGVVGEETCARCHEKE